MRMRTSFLPKRRAQIVEYPQPYKSLSGPAALRTLSPLTSRSAAAKKTAAKKAPAKKAARG